MVDHSPSQDETVDPEATEAATATSNAAHNDTNADLAVGDLANEDTEADKHALIELLLTKLRESEELMQKACGIRDGMLHVQHEGGDIDEGHLQRLDAMIEQLGQERQKYKMLLDVHMPEERESEAARQEREARELAALQEQKELLLKLVSQQKKLKELEEKQASLLALQQSANLRLQEAKQMRAELEADAASAAAENDHDANKMDGTENKPDVDNENAWRERFHMMEKRQVRMEKLLKQLLTKESHDSG
jgi:hypothetical protein